jgi:hypothetical protein
MKNFKAYFLSYFTNRQLIFGTPCIMLKEPWNRS